MKNLKLYENAAIYGKYIVETESTVRMTASKFKVSKSSIHKIVTKELKQQDLQLYLQVREVLDKNLRERHIRGGEATKKKLKNVKK